MLGAPVPAKLVKAIQAEVQPFASSPLDGIARGSGLSGGLPLCIKYIPVPAVPDFRDRRVLTISDNPKYTWGTAAYVSPLMFPLSSATFGRVGVVAKFDPGAWRVFDATDWANQQLYLKWVAYQRDFGPSHLSTNSHLHHKRLRNGFRTSFGIDCVLFRPDQYSSLYTNRHDDVWMAVSEFKANGTLEKGDSRRLIEPKICVVLTEEFGDQHHGMIRRPFLTVTHRKAVRLPKTDEIEFAYDNDNVVQVVA